MKLHAVAPGGPPEGQCKKEQKMVCNTAYDEPFRRWWLKTEDAVGFILSTAAEDKGCC